MSLMVSEKKFKTAFGQYLVEHIQNGYIQISNRYVRDQGEQEYDTGKDGQQEVEKRWLLNGAAIHLLISFRKNFHTSYSGIPENPAGWCAEKDTHTPDQLVVQVCYLLYDRSQALDNATNVLQRSVAHIQFLYKWFITVISQQVLHHDSGFGSLSGAQVQIGQSQSGLQVIRIKCNRIL